MADQSWLLRYSDLLSLGLLMSASPLLSSHLSQDGFIKHQPIASATAQTIIQSCTTTQINQYIAAFRDDWQRETAASYLVSNCGLTAIPALTKVLQTHLDAGVREIAARALGHIEGQRIIEPLMTALRTDSSPSSLAASR